MVAAQLSTVSWALYNKIQYLDSVWLSDYFPVEMSQVIGTTISVGSHMEKDEFTAWFNQEFLWSEEGSHVRFMKCHVQKRFQSDVYVNCKPVHRSKCVLVNNFEISEECLSKRTETHFQQYSKKCSKLMNDSWFKAQKEFDKAKQEFVKFPDNMCSPIIFMDIKKQYKVTLRLSEKVFKEY